MSNLAVETDARAVPASASDRLFRLGLSLPLALGLFNFLLGLVAPKQRLDDPDTMLHVVIGRWVLAHHAVPRVDFLTHSVPGTPWVAHEWLGGVASALLFAALQWHGLVIMAAFGLSCAVAIYARALLRYYNPAHALIIVFMAWFVLTVHWLARPHILALPLLVAWTALLVEARAENRAPPLWAALLMVVWVNVHASFVVGIGFTGVLAAEAVLLASGEAARIKAAKDWAVFSGVAIAASLVTPYGIDAYLLPFRLLHMKFALSILSEWKPIDFQQAEPIEYWLILFLGIMFIHGIKLPVFRTFLVLLLFVMAMQHVRNADLLVFMAPLLAAPAAGPQLRGNVRLGRGDWLERFCAPARQRGFGIAGAAAVVGIAVSLAFPAGPVAQYAPEAAVNAVEKAGIAGPVFNNYNFGDYLMFRGIKTFVDGRADMFGDDFLRRYQDAVDGVGDALPALLKQYKITWTIFPADSRAGGLIDKIPGWHRFYADDVAIVSVRDGTPGARAAPATH